MATRLFALLSLLQTPREWPGSELAERLGVTPRTIRRDVDRLRELGYPVEATMGAAGGYRLVAGTAMPPLVLDDDEAVAIAVGLRTAAGRQVAGIEESAVRALTKLEQVLPSRLRYRVRTITRSTEQLTLPPAFGTPDIPAVDPELLTVLAAAIENRERVRFRYRSHDGEQTRRYADPHRLVSSGRRWYLLAYDNDRDDWRTYRVDRVTAPERTGTRIGVREIPGGDAAAFVRQQLFSSAPTYAALVTIDAPYDEVRGRIGDGPGELEPLGADRCRLRGGTDTLEWTAIRLILLGYDFEVHEPAELVDFVRTLSDRLRRATRSRDEGAGSPSE